MSSQNNGKISSKLNDLYNQIKNSDMARELKRQLLIVARRGNEETRKVIQEFLGYLDRHPEVSEWLKSSAVVGVLLEIVPFSRAGIVMLPGFVPGAVAGCLKGSKTGTTMKSTVLGGLVAWPLKPVITLSPITGMLLVGFATGTLEEMLAGAAEQAGPEAKPAYG